MKYLILVPDGMADWPLEELGGKTPLEVANTPNMDKLAAQSQVGLALTVPEGLPPGSDVANLAIMGYDPRQYYCGRGPLEAASMGVKLVPGQAAWRCNLVTLTDGVMTDFTANHISTAEAKILITDLQARLGNERVHFYPGVSYRHLCVLNNTNQPKTTPPHDITGQRYEAHLPQGEGADWLMELMTRSWAILKDHPINQERQKQGKQPANSIWLWGGGPAVVLPTLADKFQLQGAVISAVDLVKGIGKLAGMTVVNVPGATGYLDTNYLGKASYGLQALLTHDILYLHLEAPDEAGHMGDVRAKIRAIEDFDHLILGNILSGTETWPDFKLLCLPDHPTPIKIKTHSSEPVPFFLYQKTKHQKGPAQFTEKMAARHFENQKPVLAWDLLDLMIRNDVL